MYLGGYSENREKMKSDHWLLQKELDVGEAVQENDKFATHGSLGHHVLPSQSGETVLLDLENKASIKRWGWADWKV